MGLMKTTDLIAKYKDFSSWIETATKAQKIARSEAVKLKGVVVGASIKNNLILI